MYVWIWRLLPGPLLLRMVQAVALLALVLAALFSWVFPWVEAQLPYSEVNVPNPTQTELPAG